MKTKLLFLFAWLMLAITGCSAGEPQTEESTTPPVEKRKSQSNLPGTKSADCLFLPYG